MLIAFSGLPGVGKTTIARELAKTISAVYVRIDSIEQTLRDAGFTVEGEGYEVAYAVAEDNLRLGRTVVADCVNPWMETRDAWRSVAQMARSDLVEVEILCSDLVEHRRRIETRTGDIEGLRLPSWSDVEERDYRPWERDRLVIDSAMVNVQRAVAVIVSATLSFVGKHPHE